MPLMTDATFTVVCAREGRRFSIPAGKTILEILSSAGVNVPYSCEQGVCGTCETKILAGQPDHRDLILTETEQASGKTMMICCSRSFSEELVLDL